MSIPSEVLIWKQDANPFHNEDTLEEQWPVVLVENHEEQREPAPAPAEAVLIVTKRQHRRSMVRLMNHLRSEHHSTQSTASLSITSSSSSSSFASSSEFAFLTSNMSTISTTASAPCCWNETTPPYVGADSILMDLTASLQDSCSLLDEPDDLLLLLTTSRQRPALTRYHSSKSQNHKKRDKLSDWTFQYKYGAPAPSFDKQPQHRFSSKSNRSLLLSPAPGAAVTSPRQPSRTKSLPTSTTSPARDPPPPTDNTDCYPPPPPPNTHNVHRQRCSTNIFDHQLVLEC
jgi:hypothetical protein